ncbi:MAG: SH3 domain-containing protein [Burkholderiales bacterium]|nr:SH3 domain-containing protein [Burkholderiales bacterium]
MPRTPRSSRAVRRRIAQCAASAALSFLAAAAPASDFRSVAEPAVLYDAPSLRASRLFVIGRDAPVEVIASDGTWVKVRDNTGELAWIEKKALSDRRTLVVSVPVADIRERPDEQSPVAFQAQQGVLLELLDADRAGWLRVRHADGSSGYVRISQVWGY